MTVSGLVVLIQGTFRDLMWRIHAIDQSRATVATASFRQSLAGACHDERARLVLANSELQPAAFYALALSSRTAEGELEVSMINDDCSPEIRRTAHPRRRAAVR